MKEVNPILFSCNQSSIDWVANAFGISKAEGIKLMTTGNFMDPGVFRKNMMCAVMNKSYNRHIHEVDFKLHTYLVPGMTAPECLCACLCDSVVTPFAHCIYRKVSPRASKFLFGLGAPDETLIRKYREHLNKMVADKGVPVEYLPGHTAKVYEEMLMVPINGKYDYFYLCASEENCMFIHQRAPKCGEHEYKLMALAYEMPTLNPKGASLSYSQTYESGGSRNLKEAMGNGFATATTIFDVEAFLANLWISEKTEVFVKACEPAEERHPIDTMCKLHGVKPMKQAVSYSYINITGEAWGRFMHAEEQMKRMRAAGTYTKASWYVRPHYAFRYGHMSLIRGHFAFRKCGEVVEAPHVDVIV